MAFLLGCSSGTQVTHYERLRRQPSAETMLAYQAVFGVPGDTLFPVLYEQVEQKIKKRAHKLAEKIRLTETSRSGNQKLTLLNEIIERKADESAPFPWEKKTLAVS